MLRDKLSRNACRWCYQEALIELAALRAPVMGLRNVMDWRGRERYPYQPPGAVVETTELFLQVADISVTSISVQIRHKTLSGGFL